jgi:hypothetical protein
MVEPGKDVPITAPHVVQIDRLCAKNLSQSDNLAFHLHSI